MARTARWLVGAIGGAAVLFAVGPRTRARLDGTAPEVPQTPQAVADLIAERERKTEGVRPDTEARITWGAEPGARTEYAFVYLHGFSASRRETAPVTADVARAFGANVFEARFTGHGRSGEALGRATAEDWLADTREALAVAQVLGKKVVVIGCSTGATLAMIVAAHDRPAVSAYVLLSPNFGPKSAASGLLLWPWAERWVPLVAGSERSWEPEVPEQGKYWTTRYPVSALFPMMAVVQSARTVPLERVTEPVLVLHSEQDSVVDPLAVEAAFSRMSAAQPRRREAVSGPGNDHVIAGD
ncbi:MAG: alpha/beta fold hydrolase, partial [Myxococcota bacterium]